MKANLKNDKWFTTDKRAFSPNSDGVDRDFIDPAEARDAFAFDIEKHQSYTFDGRPIPKHWHLLRSDDQEIIPSRGLGDEYKPIQHREVYDYLLDKIFPAIPGLRIEAVGTLHGGGTGVVSAIVGDAFTLPGDKSPNNQRLFFCNPCNGKGSCVLGFTTVRLFCQNQIAVASKEAGKNGLRVWHTTNASVEMDHALDLIHAQLLNAQDLRMREERLAHCKVGEQNVLNLLNTLFPLNGFEEGSKGHTRMLNKREAVLEQWEGGETAQTFTEKNGWCLFNAISFTEQNPKKVSQGTDLAQIRYSATVGSRAAGLLQDFEAVERELGVAAA